jgi:hypothetical protein
LNATFRQATQPAFAERHPQSKSNAQDTNGHKRCAELATPTDLGEAAIATPEALNGVLADAFALYFKTRISTGMSDPLPRLLAI